VKPEIRLFGESGLELDDLRKLLNRGLENTFIDRETFKRVILEDPNHTLELVYIAFLGEKPVGCLIGVYRKFPREYVEKHKSIAWIKEISILPEVRGRGIFSILVKTFEERASTDGKIVVRFSDFASWYFHPGLDIRYDFYLTEFLRKGYRKKGEVVDYEVDLKYLYLPPLIAEKERKRLEEGFVFRKAEKQESSKIAKWVNERFSAAWMTEAKMGLEREGAGVWIAEKNGEIYGFSVYGALRPNWFGPIGVDPKARGKGLGTVLLYKSLFSLWEEGHRYIIIPWTEHLFFYTQLPGIKEIIHYYILEKKLE